MFRCTDCYKEYSEHPGYCECGNDQFEEIIETNYAANEQYADADEYYDDGSYADSSYSDANYDDGSYDDGYADNYYEQPQYAPPAPKLKKRVPKEPKKKTVTMMDKIGIGVFVVCIILSLIAFIFIGAGKTSAPKDSSGKTLLEKNYNIPSNIDEFWDNTLPKGKPSAEKLPPEKILNTKLNSIDPELNTYLISLAQALINAWDRNDIKGNGVTQLEFIINPNGTLEGRRIYKYSGNKTLDNSVTKFVGEFDKFQVPPSSYKNEVIIISFSANNGSMKAYYPNFKVKTK